MKAETTLASTSSVRGNFHLLPTLYSLPGKRWLHLKQKVTAVPCVLRQAAVQPGFAPVTFSAAFPFPPASCPSAQYLSSAVDPGWRGDRLRRATCGAAAQHWRRRKVQLSPCPSMQVPELAAGRCRGMRRQTGDLLLAASSPFFRDAATRGGFRHTGGRARGCTAWLQKETRTKGKSR